MIRKKEIIELISIILIMNFSVTRIFDYIVFFTIYSAISNILVGIWTIFLILYRLKIKNTDKKLVIYFISMLILLFIEAHILFYISISSFIVFTILFYAINRKSVNKTKIKEIREVVTLILIGSITINFIIMVLPYLNKNNVTLKIEKLYNGKNTIDEFCKNNRGYSMLKVYNDNNNYRSKSISLRNNNNQWTGVYRLENENKVYEKEIMYKNDKFYDLSSKQEIMELNKNDMYFRFAKIDKNKLIKQRGHHNFHFLYKPSDILEADYNDIRTYNEYIKETGQKIQDEQIEFKYFFSISGEYHVTMKTKNTLIHEMCQQ